MAVQIITPHDIFHSYDNYIELVADVLRQISHERNNFAYALVHGAQGGKNVHDRTPHGMDTLFRSLLSFDKLSQAEIRAWKLTLKYAEVAGGKRSSSHQSTQYALDISAT
jgi:hypothetical protein